MKRNIKSILTTTALIAAGALTTTTHAEDYDTENYDKLAYQLLDFKQDLSAFELTRPTGAPETCAPDAGGYARVIGGEEAESLEVFVWGMPKDSEVDVFSIQVPGFPFGLSWYIGDIKTNSWGKGYARYIGRFNEETFIVAPGAAAAPQVHDDPIADADVNPSTGPIHTYHIGIWFNSPEDAVAAGCADIVTPFNGEHNAGIQVLNTGLFPDEAGPLLDANLPE